MIEVPHSREVRRAPANLVFTDSNISGSRPCFVVALFIWLLNRILPYQWDTFPPYSKQKSKHSTHVPLNA